MKYWLSFWLLILAPTIKASCLDSVSNEYIVTKVFVSSRTVNTQIPGMLSDESLQKSNKVISRERVKYENNSSTNATCFFDLNTESLLLNYNVDKFTLTPSHTILLDNYLMYLKNKQLEGTLMISGHADSSGTEQYNKILSENRAKQVASYLSDRVEQSLKIEDKGFGENVPVCEEELNIISGCNRRVVIEFMTN
ncbi:OmpA family protein [Vibrio diazotrophicus]|uniref:OmpA family protein n=1 Tax=Vibrio diazotrophicus TaxID=685 RepID=A0A2J8I4U7_VIBDI|nr:MULTISPECIES: OmpA family protein [Vibrio]MCF7361901.1 OmpA family protein [Vibrio sp. A1-b2]PNI05555.1 OmpA family protein [Vibrio diazotrophicus]